MTGYQFQQATALRQVVAKPYRIVNNNNGKVLSSFKSQEAAVKKHDDLVKRGFNVALQFHQDVWDQYTINPA
jgi:hypothetical protein